MMNKLLVVVLLMLTGCAMDAPFSARGSHQDIKLNPVKPKCGEQGSDCMVFDGVRYKASDIAAETEYPRKKKLPTSSTMPAVKKELDKNISGSFVISSDADYPELWKERAKGLLAADVNPPRIVEKTPSMVIRVPKNGYPTKPEVWEVMKAAAAGGKIVITSHSDASDEVTRIKASNSSANVLMNKLIKAGLPDTSISIHERDGYKDQGDKSYMEISLYRKDPL